MQNWIIKQNIELFERALDGAKFNAERTRLEIMIAEARRRLSGAKVDEAPLVS